MYATTSITGDNVRAYLEGLQCVQLCTQLRFVSLCLPLDESAGLYHAGRLHIVVNLAWLLPPRAESVWIYFDARVAASDDGRPANTEYRHSPAFDIDAWTYLGECLANTTVHQVVLCLQLCRHEPEESYWPTGFKDAVVEKWARYRSRGTCRFRTHFYVDTSHACCRRHRMVSRG